MRIVHVLTRLLRAGSEENTLASCRGQVEAGHDVYLLHGSEYSASYYQSGADGINLIKIETLVHRPSPTSDTRAFFELIRLFRRIRPHIVHTHQSKAGIIGRLAARVARVPVIVHGVHIVPFVNVGPTQRLAYLCAERVAALFTDAFVDVSRGMRDVYLAHRIGRPDRHHVVHSGFDLARFKSADSPADWREILGVGPSAPKPPTILMLAALEPRKRHLEFIDMLPQIIRRVPDVRLIMPGEGPLRAEIETRIRALDLGKHACLLGYRTDPERLVALADVCALTSTREGLPRVVMQYLAGGRPCVVSDLPGLDEVVRHGINGLIVPPNDLTAAADAIGDLLVDRSYLQALAVGAAATDLSSWEVRNMCSSLEQIYTTVSESATCTVNESSTSTVAS